MVHYKAKEIQTQNTTKNSQTPHHRTPYTPGPSPPKRHPQFYSRYARDPSEKPRPTILQQVRARRFGKATTPFPKSHLESIKENPTRQEFPTKATMEIDQEPQQQEQQEPDVINIDDEDDDLGLNNPEAISTAPVAFNPIPRTNATGNANGKRSRSDNTTDSDADEPTSSKKTKKKTKKQPKQQQDQTQAGPIDPRLQPTLGQAGVKNPAFNQRKFFVKKTELVGMMEEMGLSTHNTDKMRRDAIIERVCNHHRSTTTGASYEQILHATPATKGELLFQSMCQGLLSVDPNTATTLAVPSETRFSTSEDGFISMWTDTFSRTKAFTPRMLMLGSTCRALRPLMRNQAVIQFAFDNLQTIIADAHGNDYVQYMHGAAAPMRRMIDAIKSLVPDHAKLAKNSIGNLFSGYKLNGMTLICDRTDGEYNIMGETSKYVKDVAYYTVEITRRMQRVQSWVETETKDYDETYNAAVSMGVDPEEAAVLAKKVIAAPERPLNLIRNHSVVYRLYKQLFPPITKQINPSTPHIWPTRYGMRPGKPLECEMSLKKNIRYCDIASEIDYMEDPDPKTHDMFLMALCIWTTGTSSDSFSFAGKPVQPENLTLSMLVFDFESRALNTDALENNPCLKTLHERYFYNSQKTWLFGKIKPWTIENVIQHHVQNGNRSIIDDYFKITTALNNQNQPRTVMQDSSRWAWVRHLRTDRQLATGMCESNPFVAFHRIKFEVAISNNPIQRPAEHKRSFFDARNKLCTAYDTLAEDLIRRERASMYLIKCAEQMVKSFKHVYDATTTQVLLNSNAVIPHEITSSQGWREYVTRVQRFGMESGYAVLGKAREMGLVSRILDEGWDPRFTNMRNSFRGHNGQLTLLQHISITGGAKGKEIADVFKMPYTYSNNIIDAVYKTFEVATSVYTADPGMVCGTEDCTFGSTGYQAHTLTNAEVFRFHLWIKLGKRQNKDHPTYVLDEPTPEQISKVNAHCEERLKNRSKYYQVTLEGSGYETRYYGNSNPKVTLRELQRKYEEFTPEEVEKFRHFHVLKPATVQKIRREFDAAISYVAMPHALQVPLLKFADIPVHTEPQIPTFEQQLQSNKKASKVEYEWAKPSQ